MEHQNKTNEINQELAERISSLCLKHFDSLPKTGKPERGKEWTVLSAIVKLESTELSVVVMGTGTKCLSGADLNLSESKLHDSHAEVIVRRGFLRYLLSSTTLFTKEDGKLKVKPDVTFHFFTSQSPCGDASIFSVGTKRRCFDEQITGARLIECTGDDSMVQTRGYVRTKPGRGVRTNSVSCSDKITRWNVMGIQGGILSRTMHPVYLSSFTILGPSEAGEALRAALSRWSFTGIDPFHQQSPEIFTVLNRNFEFSQRAELQPSPGSIVWIDVKVKPFEVAVNGLKLGVTKKNKETEKGRLLISRVEIRKQSGQTEKDESYVRIWRKCLKDTIKCWSKKAMAELAQE